MVRRALNRRDFGKLSMAALGGLVAGCGRGEEEAAAPDEEVVVDQVVVDQEAGFAAVGGDPHLCRGLNACAGQGAGGENACAGQGTCATVEHHLCGGQNACKGQGGCGANPAENECKGQGHCAVPLMEGAWEKLRARFEEQMKTQMKEFGEAPAAA